MLKIGLLGIDKEIVPVFETIDWLKIKSKSDLNQIDGLIMYAPRENLLEKTIADLDLKNELIKMIQKGLPLWAVGASFLLLEKDKENSLELIDFQASEEIFPNSFSANIYIQALGLGTIKCNFYQTAWINHVSPQIGIMAEYQGKIVMARQGNILFSVFYPEPEENRVFAYFIKMIEENKTCN